MKTTLAVITLCLAASAQAGPPKKKPASPPAKDACAFWEARAGEAKVEANGPKTVRVRYSGLPPPDKCQEWPPDVMATIRAYGDRKLQRMEKEIEELKAELAKFGPGPYPADTVPAGYATELNALPAKIASYRAHGDRRDEIDLCVLWYVENRFSPNDFSDDAAARIETFCSAPPPKNAKDACAFWDQRGALRPRACYSYEPDVMRLAEWVSFNTGGVSASNALCTVFVIQDSWPAAQFLGAKNKRELISHAAEVAFQRGCE